MKGSRIPGLLDAMLTLAFVAGIAQAAPQDLQPPFPTTTVPTPGNPDPRTLTTLSQSSQFVVVGPKPDRLRPVETRSLGNVQRDLTPQTLAVSCERVKAEILRALEVNDTWRSGGGRTGKIFVEISPRPQPDPSFTVQAIPFESGWQFRLLVPQSAPEDRLVRAITQAVLMELANRKGNTRAAHPPLWLVEGLTQSILASAPDGIILQPQTRLSTDLRLDESLARVRTRLAREAPLSFHELSQPDLTRLEPGDWTLYSACAQLLVRELVRLPEGRPRIRQWLGSLQEYWNWQTGFIEAFEPTFRSLLDVEKWWSITHANFTGRTPTQAWPAAFALQKLDEALQPVGVLPSAGNRPTRLSVEEVIGTWDYTRQVPLLRQLLQRLTAIRLNAPAEVSPLVFRYYDVLDEYLAQRARAGYSPTGRGQIVTSVKLLARETIGRLRQLDGERATLGRSIEQAASPAE